MDLNGRSRIRGLLFDKDGTLFDFQLSWSSWMETVISELSGADDQLAADAAESLGYDADAGSFRIDSPFVAGTPESTLSLLFRCFPLRTQEEVLNCLHQTTLEAQQVEVVPLAPLLDRLVGAGYILGIATNDHEATARMHLERAGVIDHFSFVAGSDSGHGSKPETGMLHAFCDSAGITPSCAVMVGDSEWDLMAGREAGMATVGVLTGTATRPMLSSLADAVLPDVGELPAWLGLETAQDPS